MMPVEEFIRQANYIRDYTPVVTSTMTIAGNFSFGKYFVVGQWVVVDWSINFTTSVAAAAFVDITLPIAASGTEFFGYTGKVDAIAARVSGYADDLNSVASPSTMRLNRYDRANWTLGGTLIEGTAFYRKDRDA